MTLTSLPPEPDPLGCLISASPSSLLIVVGLLVVGPEQLPGAVRTVMVWVNRFRRSFDQIRTEVRRELHNDEIMQKLKAESQELERQVRDSAESLTGSFSHWVATIFLLAPRPPGLRVGRNSAGIAGR